MRLRLIFLVVFLTAAGYIFAQNGTSAGSSLSAEIQSIEASVKQIVSGPERRDAYLRLAHLRQLSGDIDGAARNWLEAATTIPGILDENALLSCAYCLASMGEWERAAAALEPLLSINVRARFLNITMNAIKTSDMSALIAIADNPEYTGLKQEIYFFLWKVSSNGERWRQQLVSEFPNSPEGRVAAGQVVINPSPFWFFIGGLDSLPLLASEPRTNAAPVTPTTQPPVTPPVTPPPVVVTPPPTTQPPVVVTPPVTPQPPVSTARLQTGVFSREANAQSQVNSLRQAGFSSSIERRGEMWAVIVPAGPDPNRTISDLRTAGFDSFLLR